MMRGPSFLPASMSEPDNASPAPAPHPQRRRPRSRSGGARQPATATAPAPARTHPALDRLGAIYPALFGETPKPLKRGVYEDLLAAHGEELTADGIKAALALHTRSTRYLNAVAGGQPRHDLQGQVVEPVAPDQRHHAILEVFRRRQARSPQDQRPQLRQRIVQAFEASGLGQEAYAPLGQGRDEALNALTREALEQAVQQQARESALLRAFEQGGQDLEAFAAGYGLALADARRMLDRARSRR